MAMYKYILNKINKYHQEITVDDKFWKNMNRLS